MNLSEIPPTSTAPPDARSFEEERSEVLESVFEALCRHPPDADEMAACALLVRHLKELAAPG